jgi:hypothetical protein
MLLMLLLAWGVSSDRSRISWRTVGWGLALQLVLGVVLLKTPVGSVFFDVMQAVTTALGAYTDEGARFVFGAALADVGFSFVIHVLPLILVMGSLFSILYHLGVLQRVVAVLGRALSRLMGISGAESLCAVANLVVGMTESALVVRPYLERMTRSELFLLMTLGMATVAGSVLVAYVRMLDGDVYAGHLATATLLSAPAGILIAKLMVPEVDTPDTADPEAARISLDSVNAVDAAATGALAGLRMAAYVGAMPPADPGNPARPPRLADGGPLGGGLSGRGPARHEDRPQRVHRLSGACPPDRGGRALAALGRDRVLRAVWLREPGLPRDPARGPHGPGTRPARGGGRDGCPLAPVRLPRDVHDGLRRQPADLIPLGGNDLAREAR